MRNLTALPGRSCGELTVRREEELGGVPTGRAEAADLHPPGDEPISCVSEPRKFFTQPPDESAVVRCLYFSLRRSIGEGTGLVNLDSEIMNLHCERH